jgi:hypothetical protein
LIVFVPGAPLEARTAARSEQLPTRHAPPPSVCLVTLNTVALAGEAPATTHNAVTTATRMTGESSEKAR